MKNGLIVDKVGNNIWYKDDLLHRADGPAIEMANGDNYWFFEGIPIDCSSQEEFERMIKLKSFW